MEREFKNLLHKIYTKEDMPKANLMVMENIIGRMEAFIKEILSMVLDKEVEFGRNLLEIVTDTRASISKIKSMDLAFLPGFLGIFIKVIMKMTKGKDMAKCIGQTEAFIKAHG